MIVWRRASADWTKATRYRAVRGNGTCKDFEGSAGRYPVENEPGSALVLCAVILSGGRGGSKAEMECEEEEKVRCLAHLLSLAGLLGKSVN